MNLLHWCCARWRCVSCCTCDIEMSDQVLWGVSNMVHHLTELTYMLLRCLLLVAVSEGVAGAVMTFLIVRSWCSLRVDTLCTVRGTWVDSLAATRLMVHVHEATYVLIRCALFVVHELMLLLLSSSWFMYMKWHTCWFAVHSSWHMSWCFCCYPPHGSCTWSDIRVDLLCTLRGTWVEIVDSLERSKPINCEHGAKASYVTVWRHASMACPTHSCSAKHINMYGKRTMSTRTCSSCWPRNWKMERRKLWSKNVLEMMGCTIPCKYHWKCVLGPSSWNFVAIFQLIIGVHKTLRELKKPWQAAAENVDFVRGLGPRCYHVYTTYKKGDLGDMVKIFRSHRIQMKPVYPIEVASDPGFCWGGYYFIFSHVTKTGEFRVKRLFDFARFIIFLSKSKELGQVTMVNLLREAGASDVPSLSNRSGSSRFTADAQPLRGCRKVKETRRKLGWIGMDWDAIRFDVFFLRLDG